MFDIGKSVKQSSSKDIVVVFGKNKLRSSAMKRGDEHNMVLIIDLSVETTLKLPIHIIDQHEYSRPNGLVLDKELVSLDDDLFTDDPEELSNGI